MIYKNANKKEVFKSNHAIGYQLADNRYHELVNLVIHPKGMVPEHSLPVPATFFVVSGNGNLTINTQEFQVEAGDVIEIAPNEVRRWENPFNYPLELLVIKPK